MPLVAAYAFDEGEGVVAEEIDGGVSLTGVTGWASGRHDSAIYINGVPGPSLDPFSVSTDFTLMFDLYIVAGGFVMSLTGVAGEIGTIQQGGTGIEWYPWIGPTEEFAPEATWTHVAVVATGTTRRLILDGVEVGSVSNSELSGVNSFALGGLDGYYPNIRMDNLRIYDEALPTVDILALAGTPVVSAFNDPPSEGEGSGETLFTGVAVGKRVPKGSGSAVTTWTGVAQGSASPPTIILPPSSRILFVPASPRILVVPYEPRTLEA